jgi:hypothetical protein
MMMHASEKVVALVDGQLSPSEAPALVQELARNEALVAELQACLATSRTRLAKPYDAKRLERVPAWLVDTIMRAPAVTPADQPIRHYSHGRWLLGCLKNRYRVPGWSLAAGPAFASLIVAVSAWLVLPASGHSGLVEANLGNALEKTESSKDGAVVSLRPVRTFKNSDGAWCRQFEVRYVSNQSSHGLACRIDVGNWPVEAMTQPGPSIITPSGKGPENPRNVIDERVSSMKSGEFVDRTAESELIKNKWQ